MANQQVERVATPVPENEVVKSFMKIGSQLAGEPLSKGQIAIIIAQNNLETASRKYMFNYNIGNIQHTSADTWDYFISGDKTKNNKGEWIPVKFKFRAYPDLDTGVKDYLKNLKNRGNGIVWNAMLSSDPASFSKALKKTKYYEADEKDYTAGMIAHVNAFNKRNNIEETQPTNTSRIDKLNEIMDSINKSLANDSSNNFIKKSLCRTFLPLNKFLIKINSSSIVDSIEFARILCIAIDEEMYGSSAIHLYNDNVEISCQINGSNEKSINELSQNLTKEFEEKTKKIGGIKIDSKILINKTSSYQELDINTALSFYDKFHDKFKKGSK